MHRNLLKVVLANGVRAETLMIKLLASSTTKVICRCSELLIAWTLLLLGNWHAGGEGELGKGSAKGFPICTTSQADRQSSRQAAG